MQAEQMKERLDEKEGELKTLRKRAGEQRREINRLREVNDRLVLCRECVHKQDGFCTLHAVSIGVMDDDFCSKGKRLPILDQLDTRLR